MKLWTILPVKSLLQTKSRLSNMLSQPERAELTLHLLDRTLSLLQTVPLLGETAVITPDRIVAKMAARFGCRCLAEPPGSGLNGAVTAGVTLATQNGASHCLVLPSDLPFLQQDELAALVAQVTTAVSQTTAILCGDRQQQGTNGLIVPTGWEFRFGYGRNSFHYHQQEAARLGLACRILQLPSFQFDLDTEQDFAFYTQNRSLIPS
ncbi:2-phospho-L-lactate guanylyltransferase [Candidatus Leptofilum sp.]|uniref:2-phospho-L-lactate guanylyltransferase n=1 Tax=Candidatus Leptofilum sp. TaxID=3241576 RepID=UPI003B592374